MIEEEKAILLEIDKLYTELLQESSVKWNGSFMIQPSGFSYRHKADELKKKVFELYNKFKPDYLNGQDLYALAHTCEKEVSYVEYYYNLSIKKNAAKKRHAEFLNSIYKANQQIRVDIFSLLAKIEEIKK